MEHRRLRQSARNTALLGVLFALALVLSLVEGLVALPIAVPGIRLGLSNIVVMFCALYMGAGHAYVLGLLKAGFVLMVRGGGGALLSLSGGVASITAMAAVRALFRGRPNLVAVSVAGAVLHNAGQLAAFALMMGQSHVLWYYLPVLCAVGVLVGTLTAVLLRALLPLLERAWGGLDIH